MRLRGHSKSPIVYFESYFHPRVGLTGNEDFKQPLYEMMEKEHAVVTYVSKEEISAILADKLYGR